MDIQIDTLALQKDFLGENLSEFLREHSPDANISEKVYIPIIPFDSEEAINVEKRIIMKSGTLRNMIEDLGGEEIIPIPLSGVKTSNFKKIVEYLEYRDRNPYVAPKEKAPRNVARKNQEPVRELDEWETNYCPKEYPELFELILSVNFLDIKDLLNVLCKTVAVRIEELTAEEIRKIFNIKNDFTPEEEEKIIKENDWVEK